MSHTKLIHAALFSLGALLWLGACGLPSDDEVDTPSTETGPGLVPDPTIATTRARLRTSRTLAVSTASRAEVTARRLLGDDLVETATLAVRGGSLALRALPDGRLAVEALDVDLGDVRLSAATLPPDGLALTAIHVRLRPQAMAARWSDGAVTATADGELLLDWSLAQQPGEVVPMATQHIAAVPLTVDVARGPGGRLAATLRATRPGTFFDWAGLLELGELVLTVEAAE